uniref:Uncharacterized protein n=1 Tax=Opuntia streptacantha TaxID=393608 RepID=A0A7C9EIX2_OPUST
MSRSKSGSVSDFGSNIFFNSKHSVATPTVSIVGLVSDGTEKPAKCNPPRGATEACVREATAGATPEAPPRTGAGTTELLTAGEESEPAMLEATPLRSNFCMRSARELAFNAKPPPSSSSRSPAAAPASCIPG